MRKRLATSFRDRPAFSPAVFDAITDPEGVTLISPGQRPGFASPPYCGTPTGCDRSELKHGSRPFRATFIIGYHEPRALPWADESRRFAATGAIGVSHLPTKQDELFSWWQREVPIFLRAQTNVYFTTKQPGPAACGSRLNSTSAVRPVERWVTWTSMLPDAQSAPCNIAISGRGASFDRRWRHILTAKTHRARSKTP
jgi:hypothetical protein